MEKLVSIIVPIFNGGNYILDFLESIKNQNYSNIQLILRDDKSSDNSYLLCERWKQNNEKNFKEILLLRGNKNVGLAQNVKIACQYVKGEYIFLADQDDVWFENKVSSQVKYLELHLKCVMCLCDRSITDEHLNIKVKSNYEYLGYKKRIMHCEEVVKHKYIYAANCMAIRNIDKNIFNIPLGVVCHDSFIAYMASYYGTIDFLYEPLLYYRIHSHNLSSNFCAENSSSIIQCFVKYLKSLKRIKKSNETDGLIICNEMMERYELDLKLLGSPFAIYGHKYNRIKKAYELTKRDYNDGKIGSWDK